MRGTELGGDQAAGLRRMLRPATPRVIAVTSGKGGVGKTNASVNLAVALAAQGKDVLLLDADLSLGNVDVFLGLRAERNLSHVLEGTSRLEEILIPGPGGIRVLPAGSGIQSALDAGHAQVAGLVRAFNEPALASDVLLVDTAAGLGDSVLTFTKACQEIVVVLCDEPASITDAYALMKVLHRQHSRHRFRILPNMVRTPEEGRALFVKLLNVCSRFLDVSLEYTGSIPFDDAVHRAVQRQRAVVEAFPSSPAARAFKNLARAADNWPIPDEPSAHLAFFVERLVATRPVGVDIQP